MEDRVKKWPPEPVSAFESDSSEGTVRAIRENYFYGSHKHGPTCTGKVRAIVYPLSPEARICCEAEPKEEGESQLMVRLRLCEESTFFSIGTSLTGNITLRCPKNVDDHDPEWKNQIQVRIYPDPDNDDAELLNQSPSLTVSILNGEGEKLHDIPTNNHFRLHADRIWFVNITKSYTFGLILSPSEELCNSLNEERYSIANVLEWHSASEADQETNEREPLVETADIQAGAETLQSIELEGLSQLVKEAYETSKAQLPRPSDDESVPRQIFESKKTVVKEIMLRGKKRVRKTIRDSETHAASMCWEDETRILSTLSHPHIITAIDWNCEHLTIDFEYGGKDLASLRSAANMFTVAINLTDVQERIWMHTALALEYLHEEKSIRHRDIKPHNILLSEDHQTVKVCDLGLAVTKNAAAYGSGTYQYIAPEFLLREETSIASDIWALGITMLFVLRIIPLPGLQSGAERWTIEKLKDDKMERRKMTKWLSSIDDAIKIIPDKWSLLRDMLEHNPTKRITAKELVQQLKQLISARKTDCGALLEV